MAELAPPLAMFLREYLPRDRGTSRHTVESYALCFKLLVVFAADKHAIRPCTLEIGHLDIATLLEFLEHLERDRGNGVRTRNARLAAIKAFFRFLEFRHPGYLDLAAQVREVPAKKGEEDQDTKKMDFNEGLKKTPSKKMTSSPRPFTRIFGTALALTEPRPLVYRKHRPSLPRLVLR